MVIERFDVFLVSLEPTIGSEIGKTRPALVVSPNEVNKRLNTVVVAPMTTVRRGWPTRVAVDFQGKAGEVAIDQIRTIDKARLGKKLGRISKSAQDAVFDILGEFFAR